MICSNSKYNKKGDLVYRISSGKSIFPEVLEVEYNENGDLAMQRLYDLIKGEGGKEFKKLKLITEITYYDDGKVKKVTSPESIIDFWYNGDDVAIPLLNKSLRAISVSHTVPQLQNEDGTDKLEYDTYIFKDSGSVTINDIPIDYDSIRILKNYKKGTLDLVNTEYFLLKNTNLVYYQMEDTDDNVILDSIYEYNGDNQLIHCRTNDYRDKKIIIDKADYKMDKDDYPVEFIMNFRTLGFYNSSRRILDIDSGEEFRTEDSIYKIDLTTRDNKEQIIVTNIITINDIEDKDSFVAASYTFDEFYRLVKRVDHKEQISETLYFPYDDENEVSRRVIKSIKPKKITPMRGTESPDNEEIHLYLYTTYEDKIITTEFTRYPNRVCVKDTTISDSEGRELGKVVINNGEDATIDVMFNALYDKF